MRAWRCLRRALGEIAGRDVENDYSEDILRVEPGMDEVVRGKIRALEEQETGNRKLNTGRK